MNKLNFKYILFYISYSLSLIQSFSYLAFYYPNFYLTIVLIIIAVAFLTIVFVLLINGIERYEGFNNNRVSQTLKVEKYRSSIKKLDAEANWIIAKTTKYTANLKPKIVPTFNIKSNDRVLVDLSAIIGKKYYKPLIESIIEYKRILLVGAQGSGKTSVMLWLAEYKKQNGNLFIIDTHTSPKKWPKPSFVIGAGEDYDKAQGGLDVLMNTLSSRYRDIGNGKVKEGEHSNITLFSDEWTLLPDNISNFSKQYVKPLFTKSRKCNVNLSLAVHDTSVDALGMTGLSNLKNSFEAVVYCKKVKGEFTTQVAYGFGKAMVRETFLPPGPYTTGNKPFSDMNSEYNLEDISTINRGDLPILEAMRSTYNYNINGVGKTSLRKQLNLSASKESYLLIENIAKRYNIQLI